MHHLALSSLLTVLPTAFNLSEALEIVSVGFIFVLFVLALLAMITAAWGALFVRLDAKMLPQSVAPEPIAPAVTALPRQAVSSHASQASECEQDPALPAVIAAAVHVMMEDRAHRIVSIHSDSSGWAQEGRRAIFSSHHVR